MAETTNTSDKTNFVKDIGKHLFSSPSLDSEMSQKTRQAKSEMVQGLIQDLSNSVQANDGTWGHTTGAADQNAPIF